MKQVKKILATAFTVILIFSAIVYTSCHRDKCRNVVCLNGGACSKGLCYCPTGYTGDRCQYSSPSIAYYNNTFTPVYITVNGQSSTIQPGSSVIYYGYANDFADAYAYTFGQTSSGSQIGLKISWDLSDYFPSTGTSDIDIDVSSNYFFLKIKNISPYNISQEFVNYGLLSETSDNVYIPNDGYAYDMGYYNAWTNSNVKLYTASGIYWYYGLNLPFTYDQSYTFVAN